MMMKEFGQENFKVIMLLHGGGLSWWNYKEVSEILRKEYHVVIPLLNGHSDSNKNFVSIEESAKTLCTLIKEKFNGCVFAIGGLSLGGQILIEMLSQVPDICRFALIESALIIPMPFINKMTYPMVSISYGLIKKRWFAKLQFLQLGLKQSLFENYYKDTCKITKQDMIAFLRSNSSYKIKDTLKNTSAKVTVVVGGSEQKKMKNSAMILHEILSDSKLLILPRYRHGDFSINHAEQYAKFLMKIIS